MATSGDLSWPPADTFSWPRTRASRAAVHHRNKTERFQVARRTTGRVVLLSIHPHFADAILRGNKRVELRRKPVAPDVTHVVIYATAPVKAIVGSFEIKSIDQGSKTSIWNIHGPVTGVTRREFWNYFKGSSRAVAIRITKPSRLQRPVPINSISGVTRPPQSFQYVDPRNLDWLLSPPIGEIDLPTSGQIAV